MPMLLKACINGTREPGSHPALPLTPSQMARAAAASAAAGAGALHLHVRGADGRESLAGEDVARTIRAVRGALPSFPLGVSSGLWIVPGAAERHELVASWTLLPDFVSVNFHEPGSPELAALLIGRRVGVEAGLCDAPAAEALVSSGLGARCLRVLLEPQEATVEAALAAVAAIEGVLDRAGLDRPRLLHGSGPTAWALNEEAARRGYDTRAGLEDMLLMPDGTPAPDNAAIITEARRRISKWARATGDVAAGPRPTAGGMLGTEDP